MQFQSVELHTRARAIRTTVADVTLNILLLLSITSILAAVLDAEEATTVVALRADDRSSVDDVVGVAGVGTSDSDIAGTSLIAAALVAEDTLDV